MKLPYCTKDWKGSSGKALLRYFSLLAPELMTMVSAPRATATSAWRTMEATKASDEKGLTTPEVPTMEIPSMIPRRGLKVFEASSLPAGMLMVISTPPVG